MHIAIIGGGFSGAVTAINLVHSNQRSLLRITIVNPTSDIGSGLAYRYQDDNLLLNVPAGNMSALVDKPSYFLEYCQSIDPSISSGSFVSRRLFGQYMRDLWSQIQTAHPGVIESRVDEAISLTRTVDKLSWNINLASGQSFNADQVVLALGHQAPKPPIPLEPKTQSCVINPWDYAAMHSLPHDQPIVILGTGHTAVDALFCLTQTQPRRPIYLVSRHGLLPRPHRLSAIVPKSEIFPEYLASSMSSVRACAHALRLHLKTMAKQGGDWRDALNELRQHTSQLWQSWSLAEQQRFLRHLQAFCDVHRHRLAPMAAQRLDQLITTGQAQVISGRITSIEPKDCGIEVVYRARGSQQLSHLSASAAINCIGADTNIHNPGNPLLSQLLADGLIQPNINGIGIKVTPQLALLNAHKKHVDGLWYVGPLLKGVLWEATAVRELRKKAHFLSQTLLTITSR